MGALLFYAILCVLVASGTSIEPVVVHYEIEEESARNTFIGNVGESAGLFRHHNSSTLSELRFSFLAQPDLDKSYFAIEDSTGIMRTRASIDRDTICPMQKRCVLTFDIAVRPLKHFTIIKVNLEILDVNDRQPQFPEYNILHEISEASVPGTRFSIPTAVDPDSGSNTIQGYELVSSSKHFALEAIRKSDGSTDLQLVLQERLDRETNDFYQMTIIAYDGGEPRRTGSMRVDISVLDTNDNKPTFENSTYEISINENVAIGTTIVKVKAVDPDSGPNGEVSYTFSASTVQNYADLYNINKRTGEVFVVGDVDYEIGSIYLLVVEARDNGADSMPAEATVVVRVNDTNDNAPVIAINTLTASSVAEVAENSALGTFVAHVSVVDADDKNNGRVDCFLNNKNFKLHKLEASEFKIVTARKFDRELKSEQAISLKCRDRGSSPQVSITNIVVQILDRNDNAPKFEEDVYSVVIAENNPVGATVMRVRANDPDTGDNGKVRYSVETKAKRLVDIDENTGEITAQVMFDYETMERFDFRVFVTDHTNSRRTATATIELIVTDTNDARPEFVENSYKFGVFENDPINTEIGSVTATDSDSPPFDYFTYKLDSTYAETEYYAFAVDPETGMITTETVLDREKRTNYELIISAVSGDNPSSSSTTTVSIFVVDRNDNPPVFSFPNRVNQTVFVSNAANVGHVAAQLRAHDLDKGVNAKLTYHITSGNADGAFTVDSVSGVIAVGCDLTNLDGEEFKLEVAVMDAGEPQLSSEATFCITVKDGSVLPRETVALGSFLLPTNILIAIFAFVMAAVLIAIIFTIVIVIIVRRRKRKFHPPIDAPEASGKHQSNGGQWHQQNGTKSGSNSYTTARNMDETINGSDDQMNEKLSFHNGTSTTTLTSPTVLPVLPHWYPSPPDHRRPLSPDRSQHMKQSSTLPKHISGQLTNTLSPLKSTAKSRSGSLEVNFPTKNLPPTHREDAEHESGGSVSNSDSGRGNSSEDGENNVAVVAFIATEYVRSCSEKHSSEPAESADNIHVNDPTSVAISGSHGQLTPLSGSHYGGQLTPIYGSHYDCQLTPTAEPIHPDDARRWRGIAEHQKDASRSRFIKPLPQDPPEYSRERSGMSPRPYNAGRSESRGVNVDPSMLATGSYVGYDPVDTSI